MHDVRTRIRAEVLRNEFGYSLQRAANAAGVSKSSVFSWTKPRTPALRSPSKRGPTALHSKIEAAIRSSIQMMPLTTAAEIAQHVLDATGIEVSRTTVYKSLRIMNMSRKIATRSRQHQTRNMSHPFFHGTPFASDAMAFDEAGFYINSIPKRGWGPKGQRVPKAAIARSARLSLLLVTDRDGVVATRILKGGVKGSHVADFVATLPPGRPMILDNAAVHRSCEVRAACAAARIPMNFIPPYSPWYNPVENAFAQAKARFQKLRLRSSDFVSDIMDSVASVRNFHGMFESASRMWAEDVSST